MKGRTEMTFLRDNLEEQLDCYRQLNELEKDKQDALISNDSRSIDRIISQEEIIIRRRNQLEADRVQWAASFTPWEDGQVSGHPEIVDLKNCLGQELEELQSLNQINSQLISSQLAYINYSVQSVAGDTKPMYGSPGTLNKPQRDPGVSRGFVDWNA
ncbi:MAG: flagellar protein FlgN [Gracilibacteraceae bacterium]|jgi:flagellar biosynthesis/type III secretory pathway chaperone|nr:flagellar protein FlgN [Gracilibacteraceae bacterium]